MFTVVARTLSTELENHLADHKTKTLLRWHRAGFRLFWKIKSRAQKPRPGLNAETIVLIQRLARENSLWFAERIQGELLKLGIKVAKRTIQKVMRAVRSQPAAG
jgi:hypothetical protein